MTFVDNHDTIRDDSNAMLHDKLHGLQLHPDSRRLSQRLLEGLVQLRPGSTGTPNGIAALVAAHEKYAGGATEVLFTGDDVYIMQRTAGCALIRGWFTC